MRWIPRCTPENEGFVAQLSAEARISPLLARLLASRGITSSEQAARFLAPSLDHLHSPYEMLGMRAAVDRLRRAIERKERVLIYGDYDVDGTTAVVILKTAIELCGGTCEFHIPHRLREGYGMRDDVIERAHAGGVSLIISVDTGIRAFAAAETCHRMGLDLIVTDHHLPEAEGVPRAVAVLNPNQRGCGYPCKALCGAGVAFKLAQGLLEGYPNYARLVPSFLKVVAIATIADAVPLVDENRVFAKLGLDGLRSPVNAGLRALMEVAELNGPAGRHIKSADVAFRLAPRLNAAGRMDVAKDVVDLFTIKDAKLAREIATRLNTLNAERQAEEARIISDIQARIEADPEVRSAYCIVIDGEGWHKGVIGIVASRVVDRYHRPALVISREGDVAQGSGRSIEAFHLMDALESCAPMFNRFGGHAHAAGFALPSERIPALRQALCDWAKSRLTSEDLCPVLRYDAEVSLEEVTPQLFEFVEQLEPFGMANPQPVFAAHGTRVLVPPRLLKERHMKLRVRQEVTASNAAASGTNGNGGNGRAFDLLAWRMADRIQQQAVIAGDLLDIAFTVEQNQHPEFGGLQLSLCDFGRNGAAVKAAAATSTDAN